MHSPKVSFGNWCHFVRLMLTVLVGLYEEPEKPVNALEFIQQHLTADGPATSDFEVVKKENEELKLRNEEVFEYSVLAQVPLTFCSLKLRLQSWRSRWHSSRQKRPQKSKSFLKQDIDWNN